MVIGANPTDGHPVFASRMKKRLRQGAKLIVIDPRRIDLVRIAACRGRLHLPLKPGTNVAVLTALAHVIVTEGLVDEAFVRERCDWTEFEDWAAFVAEPQHSPEAVASMTGVSGRADPRRGAALRHRRQRRDLLRPRRHRAQPGLDHGDGHRQPRHGDRQYRPAGRRREPAARPEQRAGLLRHGLVPARAAGLSPHLRTTRRATMFEALWGVKLDAEPGLRIPNMLDAAVDGTFKGLYIQGEDILQSDPEHQACRGRPRGDGMRRRAGPLPQRDRELRPCLPAGLDLPREGRHLHQCRAPHPARAQGDGAEERPRRLGGHAWRSPRRWVSRWHYDASVRDHGRDRRD